MATNFNALLMGGFNTGRELRRQDGLNNALADYLSAPDDPAAIGNIARYDPRTAFQVQGQQQERQALLEKERQARLATGMKAVGQAALLIAQKPADQQAQAWDQQIDALVAAGYDGLAPYRGKYSPEALQSVIAQSGLSNEYIQGQKPSYMAIPEGGTLVNTKDSAAVAQFGAQPNPSPSAPASDKFADFNGAMTVLKSMTPQGFVQWQQQNSLPVQVTSKDQLDALPSGALVMGPNGEVRRKP